MVYNYKVFDLALSDAFMDDYFNRVDADGRDLFLKYCLAGLGFDPTRAIDDELITEAIPRLAALGIDYAEYVKHEEEMEAKIEAMKEAIRAGRAK